MHLSLVIDLTETTLLYEIRGRLPKFADDENAWALLYAANIPAGHNGWAADG